MVLAVAPIAVEICRKDVGDVSGVGRDAGSVANG
jgi:hypothetical protein